MEILLKMKYILVRSVYIRIIYVSKPTYVKEINNASKVFSISQWMMINRLIKIKNFLFTEAIFVRYEQGYLDQILYHVYVPLRRDIG